MLLLFLGSAAQPACAAALARVTANRALFDDVRGCFFGITIDPSDEIQRRIAQQLPGLRFFLDYDRAVSRLFGASEGDTYTPFWLVVDRQLRVAGRFELSDADHAFACFAAMTNSPADDGLAPVLIVPRILEPGIRAQHLIALYEAKGGEESGFYARS